MWWWWLLVLEKQSEGSMQAQRETKKAAQGRSVARTVMRVFSIGWWTSASDTVSTQQVTVTMRAEGKRTAPFRRKSERRYVLLYLYRFLIGLENCTGSSNVSNTFACQLG